MRPSRFARPTTPIRRAWWRSSGVTDSVDVSGWDQPRVELTAEGDLGNRMHFNARTGARSSTCCRAAAAKRQIAIRVPSKERLSVTLVNGNINVHGVAG